MEMREKLQKILEMREMRETFKNAGDILEMWESPAQCGRVDSYGLWFLRRAAARFSCSFKQLDECFVISGP